MKKVSGTVSGAVFILFGFLLFIFGQCINVAGQKRVPARSTLVMTGAAWSRGDINKDFLNAAKNCQVIKVHDLLRSGAEINARDKQDRSALILAYPRDGNFQKYPACAQVLQDLLIAGAPVGDAQGGLAGFILVWALERNRSDYVESMRSKGATANNWAGVKAIQAALKKGDSQLVDRLLSFDAPIPDNAVALAAESGIAKLVSTLLDHRAKIDSSEMADEVFIEGNIVNSRPGSLKGKDALIFAIASGHVEVVRLLLARGANPNYSRVYEGGTTFPPRPHCAATPLSLAAALGHTEIVGMLLDKNAPRTNLTTPLVAATLGGHAEVVRLLLARISDEQKNLALMALTMYIEERWRLTGLDNYRKESRALFAAEMVQTNKMTVILSVFQPTMTRDGFLKKAEGEGFLPTLSLLERKR